MMKVQVADGNTYQGLRPCYTCLDVNGILDYAGNYFDDLKFMHILFKLTSFTSQGPDPSYVKFNSALLKQFLQKRQLEVFSLAFERQIPHVVRTMTNGGRALIPLSDQQSLHSATLFNLHFDDISDFVTTMSGHRKCGQALRYLYIGDLSIGSHLGPVAPSGFSSFDDNLKSIWSLKDAKAIAKAIKEIDTLEFFQLSQMEDGCLQGRDETVLAVMLSNKPALTHFGIKALDRHQMMNSPSMGGMFGFTRPPMGSVTDRSIEIIVQTIGSTVEELDFGWQLQVTATGFETILRGCPRLRSLKLNGFTPTVQEMERVLPLSASLIFFNFGTGAGTGYGKSVDQDKWLPAVLATEGRVFLQNGIDDVIYIDEDKLSSEFYENMMRSKELLKEFDARYEQEGLLRPRRRGSF